MTPQTPNSVRAPAPDTHRDTVAAAQNLLEAAYELAADRGLPLVPCDARKRPLLKEWTAVELRSLEQVEEAFSRPGVARIGVRTGRVSGLCVIDVDPRNGGEAWYRENFDRLGCGRIHCTQSGGWHLLFTMPEAPIRNSANRIAPGVDVRADGGQVIWWPAHGCEVPVDDEPGPLPAWLLEQLLAVPAQAAPAAPAPAPGEMAEGGRNAGLTKLGGKLRRIGLSPGEIEAALLAANAERCQPPLPDAEVRTIAASLGRYAPAGQSAAPLRRWIDWQELEGGEAPPRLWRMQDWMTDGPMLVAGRGGIGKSLLAQQLGTHLALARAYLDAIPQPVRTLMWACEDDRNELWRRQEAICRHLDVPLSKLEGLLTLDARLGLDNALFTLAYGRPDWTPLMDELRAQVNDTRAELLILDNIGQVFGGNENDRHHVTAFVNGLVGLQTERPLTVMILGHPARGAGSEFSGSSAWENAVRMRWYIGPTLPDQLAADVDPDPLVRYVSKRKANYSAQDWRRLRYEHGVLVAEVPEAAGPRFDASARRELAQAIVVKGLRRLIDLGMDPTPGVNSPNFLPRKLIELRLHEDHSKRELTEALNGCLTEERIVIREARGSDRKPRKVLRLPEGAPR